MAIPINYPNLRRAQQLTNLELQARASGCFPQNQDIRPELKVSAEVERDGRALAHAGPPLKKDKEVLGELPGPWSISVVSFWVGSQEPNIPTLAMFYEFMMFFFLHWLQNVGKSECDDCVFWGILQRPNHLFAVIRISHSKGG